MYSSATIVRHDACISLLTHGENDRGFAYVLATHMNTLTKSREFHEIKWSSETYVQIFSAQVRMAGKR